MRKRLVCALLVLALALSLAPAAFADAGLNNFRRTKTYTAATFADVSASDWFAPAVEAAYELGLVDGVADAQYDPAGHVTVAATLALACRVHNIYNGGSGAFEQGDVWYQVYIDYAAENGIAPAGRYSDYNADATRADFAVIMAAALPDEALPALNDVESVPDVPLTAPYAPAVYKLYRAGVLTGNDDYGTYTPDAALQRSAVAALVSRMADSSLRQRFTLAEPKTAKNELRAGGKTYRIGMSVSELTALAGAPDERVSGFGGCENYIFGTDTYKSFFIAQTYGGKVVGLMSAGPAFTYMGYKAGMAYPDSDGDPSESPVIVSAVSDKNDGGILHAVHVYDRSIKPFIADRASPEELYGESRIIFHLTNAFRLYHGLSPLGWDAGAAEAARLHSQDMADQDYFEHQSLDGRTPWDRMGAQGVVYHAAGENIVAGYRNGFTSYNGWVNSAGHRSNMLEPRFEKLGVGGGYNKNSVYCIFFTQDFFA